LWFRHSSPQRAIAGLAPGYFAAVMATGIVSQGMALDGAAAISDVLLAAGIGVYVLLAVANAWRIARYHKEFAADAADPGRLFDFFTFVAASDVLSARLAVAGAVPAAVALLAAGGAGWLLLTYWTPMALVGWQGPPPALARANGTWFLWVVGTVSISVAAASVTVAGGPASGALAIACWAVGVVLYLVIAALVTASLLQYPRQPADLTPPYWIFMGACAICVLAGTQILRLPADPVVAGVRSVVSGVSVLLWAFGTWLIPVLIFAGAWRHLLRRVPLRYDPALWSSVFPIGMHAVASRGLGQALRVPWLVSWGTAEAWVALAAWCAVGLFPVMRSVFRREADHPR
jgi:tellurite resistance protein TehA-like permease